MEADQEFRREECFLRRKSYVYWVIIVNCFALSCSASCNVFLFCRLCLGLILSSCSSANFFFWLRSCFHLFLFSFFSNIYNVILHSSSFTTSSPLHRCRPPPSPLFLTNPRLFHLLLLHASSGHLWQRRRRRRRNGKRRNTSQCIDARKT